MKTVLMFLFIISMALRCSPQAMTYKEPQRELGPAWLHHTPGTELQLAANCFFDGVLLLGGGFVAVTVGLTPSTPIAGLVIGGSLMIIASPVFDILAWVHIKRAGTLMDMKRVTFGGTPHGIGLTYNL
jgi:hypothetical protein